MPTARLIDSDRMRINGAFEHLLDRVPKSRPIPLQPKDLQEFYVSLLPVDVKHAMQLLNDYQLNTFHSVLRENNQLAVRESWRAEFWMAVPECEQFEAGAISFEARIPDAPCLNFHLPDTHPAYSDMVEWAHWFAAATQRRNEAVRYVNYCIEHANTAGQIARLLPDLVHYLPESDIKRSLMQAERRSRMPVKFKRNTEMYERTTETVALASLCPPVRGTSYPPFSDVRMLIPKKEAP